ncbi:MAG TPA: DJ-1/PfpI family protein [Allosphingosinicella sp.]|nr:DJ-1/PfpI family protein [Allosphingosinicella sp.]
MHRRDAMKAVLAGAAPLVLAGDALAATPGAQSAPVPDGRLTAPLALPASGRIRAAFLISPDAEVVDFSGPWGVFEYVLLGESSRQPFDLYTVGASREPVTVSGGMTIVPRHGFADAPAPDIVVVPALNLGRLSPAALDWLRAVHPGTAVTMSVCNGSFVLARAGLLDGRSATAHHGGYRLLQERFPNVRVMPGRRYVEDGRLATSGGLTSGVDLAMRIVERYFGREVARETARRLEYQGTGWMHPDSNAEFAA